MTIYRKVKRVIDGDTFEVYRKVGNTRFVRLAGVNAPELYQKGGREAADSLKRLIEGKTITLISKGRSYSRLVADVGYRRRKL